MNLLNICNIFLKLARKQDGIDILKQNIGNYIHFSDSDRFGISYHKDIHPGNPRGLYGFHLTNEKFQKFINGKHAAFNSYSFCRYIYIFSVSGNVLNLDNVNAKEIAEKISQFVEKNYSQNPNPFMTNHFLTTGRPGGYMGRDIKVEKQSVPLLEWLGELIDNLIYRKIFNNTHTAFNILIRGIGYDAIETKQHGFRDHINEQIVVLNPSSINLISKINNPLFNEEDSKTGDIEFEQ